MGDIVIRLRGNVASGAREVVVEYDSDADLTTLEHEQRHREIVERLVAGGVITREEAPAIVFQERSDSARGQSDSMAQGAG